MNAKADIFPIGDRPLEGAEVLYEFEEPLIFVSECYSFKSLWYWQCSTGEGARYWVAPCTNEIVSDLRDGKIPVLDALLKPWAHVVDLSREMEVKETRLARDEDRRFLPTEGALLYPNLEPPFSLRLLGEKLGSECVPVNVGEMAFKMGRLAWNKAVRLAASLAGNLAECGKAELFHSLQSLPVRSVRFGSFEVAFSLPADFRSLGKEKECEDVLDALRKVFADVAAVVSETSLQLPHSNAILEIAFLLGPPLHGVVDTVELQGSILGGMPSRITRDISKKIRVAAKAARKRRETLTATGLIRDFDKDLPGFILRQVCVGGKDHQEIACEMNEEFYDDAYECFHGDIPCEVVLALSSSSKAEVITLQPLPNRED